MKVSYRGVHVDSGLPPKLQEKLDARFAKLSKILEKKGEREAHVVITMDGSFYRAEVTIYYNDHQMVGNGTDADLSTAMHAALDKLETQAIKLSSKANDQRKRSDITDMPADETGPAALAPSASSDGEVRVFRVNHHAEHKPMTLEEAMIEINHKNRNYVAYHDADKACLSVLVRRRDGNFDLIES